MTSRVGATTREWAHWVDKLDLTTELTPVVCRVDAAIALTSGLSELGKVPSLYNRQGLVVGMKGWPTEEATLAQIRAWAKEPDYGIGLNTRKIHAIDIDVEDPVLVALALERIQKTLGVRLPARGRSDSARTTLLFQIPEGDDWTPRPNFILPDAGGLIELLGPGRFTVLCGRHQKGGMYTWPQGLPTYIPVVAMDLVDDLWDSWADGTIYPGADAPAAKRRRQQVRRKPTPLKVDPVAQPDPVVTCIVRQGFRRANTIDGVMAVWCPWEDEHTKDTGPSGTVWFLAGSGGYEHGHFRCLHAHCEGRTDRDFLEAIGYVKTLAEEFASGLTPEDDKDPSDGGQGLTAGGDEPKVVGKGRGVVITGKPWKPSVTRIHAALSAEGWWRRLAYDTFRESIIWADWSEVEGVWNTWIDGDVTKARMALESAGCELPPKELVRDVVRMVAEETPIDPLEDWLRGLEWDGQSRIAQFMPAYMGADNTPYTRAVGLYMWSALAGRVLEPGCQADMVPIFVSEQQGTTKSSAVAAIAPHRDFAALLDLSERDADLSRRMRGKVIAELVELRGMAARDMAALRAFITARSDSWVPKYQELAVTVKRRYLMVGTTNSTDFLADDTGSRRWLPVDITQGDTIMIERDRDQLWAEGRTLFQASGIAWQDAERLAKDVHQYYHAHDDWQTAVQRFLLSERLDGGIWGETMFESHDVLLHGIGIRTADMNRVHQVRVGRILRHLGYYDKIGKEKILGRRTSVRRWRRKLVEVSGDDED